MLEAAATASPPLREPGEELASWVADLDPAEKDTILLRLLRGEGRALVAPLRRRFAAETGSAAPASGTRTLTELLEDADRRREEAEARRQAEQEARRAEELDRLASRGEAAWAEVETLVASKSGRGYADAVRLLKDLRDLAVREETGGLFDGRLGQLRERHAKKRAFSRRLREAGQAQGGAGARALDVSEQLAAEQVPVERGAAERALSCLARKAASAGVPG